MTVSVVIRRAVEDALSVRFGGRVTLAADVQNFPPSCVFRCTLMPPSPPTAPETVILRVPREGGARSGRARLDREQAALDYLAPLGGSLAPRLLAGGGAAGFLVTEDLGASPSLLDLLLGKDLEAAEQGMIGFARGLGRLHARTAGRSGSVRPVLPTVPVPVSEHWRQVRSAVTQLGLPAPEGVDGDVESLARLLAGPNDCVALSSGDASVVNCKVHSGGVRFFDFEDSCFRHPLVDAAVLRFPYPTGGPPWRLPCDLTRQAEAAYREETAWDDDLYERGMAAAGAAWTILRLARLPRVDAGPDRDPWLLLPSDWSGPTPTRSRRRQLVATLETCIASGRQAQAFGAMTAWCEALADALRGRWPEAAEALPLYPALFSIP